MEPTREVVFTVALTVPANNPAAREWLEAALKTANEDSASETIGVTPITARIVGEGKAS